MKRVSFLILAAVLVMITGCNNIITPEMVFVQGGAFTMGCTSERESDCNRDEMPAHQVTVSDFQIGKYPVTQAQGQNVGRKQI